VSESGTARPGGENVLSRLSELMFVEMIRQHLKAADAVSRAVARAAGVTLLADGRQVAAVAAAVGYDSEAAFSRAFKRLVGRAPGTWRREASRPDPSRT
jgi:AraC-like DNA-binding protein